MKPTGNQILCGLIIVAVGVWVVRQGRMAGPGPAEPGQGEVEYQGQHFKLAKTDADADNDKEEPDELDPSEQARVEQAVAGARVDRTYRNRLQLALAISNLRFPGYGMRQLGEKPQPDGTSLAGFAIEIPRTDKFRLLVFRGRGGSYTLIDDFVTVFAMSIMQMREEAGQLHYCTLEGKPLISRPLDGR